MIDKQYRDQFSEYDIDFADPGKCVTARDERGKRACVRACVRACGRACVRACVCESAPTPDSACARACVRVRDRDGDGSDGRTRGAATAGSTYRHAPSP